MDVPVVVAESTSPACSVLSVAVSEARLPESSLAKAAAESVMLTAPELLHVDVKPSPATPPFRSNVGATLGGAPG